MKQEHPGRETQESPGFSRGEKVNKSGRWPYLMRHDMKAHHVMSRTGGWLLAAQRVHNYRLTES